MRKFLLTVCAFGLLFSSALAQEKSLDELDRESARIWSAEGLQRVQFARTVPSEQTSELNLSLHLLLIVHPAAISMSASSNNRNTVNSRQRLQAISRTSPNKTSVTSAITTGLRECS
jgi:hypothetical protein